jgi:hypothetical protein
MGATEIAKALKIGRASVYSGAGGRIGRTLRFPCTLPYPFNGQIDPGKKRWGISQGAPLRALQDHGTMISEVDTV